MWNIWFGHCCDTRVCLFWVERHSFLLSCGSYERVKVCVKLIRIVSCLGAVDGIRNDKDINMIRILMIRVLVIRVLRIACVAKLVKGEKVIRGKIIF